MAGKAGTNGASTDGAPRYEVVEALATAGAATFMSDVLEEAHDALRDKWTAAAGEGVTAAGLAPMQKGALRLLLAHRAQLVTATTATTTPGGEK